MAHALKGYDGKCAQIHGHSYELSVTVIGEPNSDRTNPKLGMVMDFGDLKAIVKKQVIDRLDHALILNEVSKDELESSTEMFARVEFVPYQPTCENLLLDIKKRVKPEMPKGISLHSLKLVETATSFVEWFEGD